MVLNGEYEEGSVAFDAKRKELNAQIQAVMKGKECLSEISQNILKNNIYNYLISFQYDAQDRRKVCNALEFNSKEILIQESKIAILSEK